MRPGVNDTLNLVSSCMLVSSWDRGMFGCKLSHPPSPTCAVGGSEMAEALVPDILKLLVSSRSIKIESVKRTHGPLAMT